MEDSLDAFGSLGCCAVQIEQQLKIPNKTNHSLRSWHTSLCGVCSPFVRYDPSPLCGWELARRCCARITTSIDGGIRKAISIGTKSQNLPIANRMA